MLVRQPGDATAGPFPSGTVVVGAVEAVAWALVLLLPLLLQLASASTAEKMTSAGSRAFRPRCRITEAEGSTRSLAVDGAQHEDRHRATFGAGAPGVVDAGDDDAITSFERVHTIIEYEFERTAKNGVEVHRRGLMSIKGTIRGELHRHPRDLSGPRWHVIRPAPGGYETARALGRNGRRKLCELEDGLAAHRVARRFHVRAFHYARSTRCVDPRF